VSTEPMTTPLSEAEHAKFAYLIAQVWADDAVAAEYSRHPHDVLAGYGIDYPRDLPAPAIPARPDGDVEVENLELVAGFSCSGTLGSASTAGCPASSAGTVGTFGCFGETDPITQP
jgi:hypothetical protein